jgi:hypothetical protein
MSLTSHLIDKDSPVLAWINERFPGCAAFLKDARKSLPEASSPIILPLGEISPTTTGMAFDYRMRYYLGATPPREFVAWRGVSRVLDRLLQRDDPGHPALWRHAYVHEETGVSFPEPPEPDDPDVAESGIVRFFDVLDEMVRQVSPVGRRLPLAAEVELGRGCFVLAMLEQARRVGLYPTSPLATLRWDCSVDQVLALVPVAWTDDLTNMSWAFHDAFRDRLRRPAILNPTFDGSAAVGGADADLIWGGCLIDIKATTRPALDLGWLRQLLGYVVLDWDDEYRIDSAGIYLARHAHLLCWPTGSLLERVGAPGGPGLPELRADFRRHFGEQ